MMNLNDWAGVWAIRNTHPCLATTDGHEHYKQESNLPVLNVAFVEQLMGLPMGWTELKPSETPSCPTLPSSSDD